MTTSFTETARLLSLDILRDIAVRVGDDIAAGRYDEIDLAALQAENGLLICWSNTLRPVVWHRTADDTVVVWAGNDLDPDMSWALVEVPVVRTKAMMSVCATCGSDRVFFDAYVGVNDPTDVRTFDAVFCDDCGTTVGVDVIEAARPEVAR
jgi:hypothetical protein